jgi:CubicO group peptidase (beta-lactamase class C family)/peptidoglycan/LPS O-acetylase OafA/YrhL
MAQQTHPRLEEEASGRSARDPFLDAVRAVAIVRVVVWHMFGFAFISYVVAAMPAVFFVSGSLLAASVAKSRNSLLVVFDRLRRVFIPLWGFCAVVWLVLAAIARWRGEGLPIGRAVTWFLPVFDPVSVSTEGGWISSPLWFVRALLWLLLLAPVLLALVRRFGAATLVAFAGSVVAIDWIARQPGWTPTATPRLWWYLGDLFLYGTFFVAGFLHHLGRFQHFTTRRWVLLSLAFAGAACWWRLTQPVRDGIVNNSHPLHLFVGAAWIALAFAATSLITVIASRPVPSAGMRVLSKRSLTIYLWHTTVMVLVIEALERRGSDNEFVNDVAYVVLTAAGIAVAVALFGWVEDLAARRRPALWPASFHLGRAWARPIAAGAVLAVVLVLALEPWAAPQSASGSAPVVHIPRVPSQSPPPPTFAAPAGDVTPTVTAAELPATLDTTIRQWAAKHRVPGVLAGILSPADGLEWTGATGRWPDTKSAARVHDIYDLASATKLFTAALVLRAVDDQLISLDDPLPTLDAVPNFPYADQLSVRVLLSHQSGLVNYRNTPEYRDNPESIGNAGDAVRVSGDQPLDFEPGTKFEYSSVNYLVLGLLLEQVTGQPYDQLLDDQILSPVALTETSHLPPTPGEPHAGAAGIVTTTNDLLRATQAIIRDTAVVSPDARAVMTKIDPASGYGIGSMGFCPCVMLPNGLPSFFAIGYFGASAVTAYVPSLDLVVVVNVTDGLTVEAKRFGQVLDLIHTLATTAAKAWHTPTVPPPGTR